jgi:hypothetical protein
MLVVLFALTLLLGAQTQAPAAACANVWRGHEAEIDAFLKTAKVEKVMELPIGVTRPRRAFLEPGGLVKSFAWKPLKPGMQSGYFESYKSEIAAYQLDKWLGLNMVPVVVERTVQGDVGAAVLWLDNVRAWETVLPLPKPPSWGRELARMKMFDDLIGNGDRNKGNLLVDEDWHLYLIDHSRAFVIDLKLPQELQTIDRALWGKMLALDEPTLARTLGAWLDVRQRGAMLRRRDVMKKKIDALVARHGQAIFF